MELNVFVVKTTTIQRKPSGPAHKPKTYVEQLQQLNPGSKTGHYFPRVVLCAGVIGRRLTSDLSLFLPLRIL